MKVLTTRDVKLPKHKKRSHKGENGRLLIIGGSVDYVGALTLAGLAALRSGADWVTIAAPEKTAWAINTYSPDLITKKLKGKIITDKHTNKLLKLARDFDAVLVGNGMGTNKATKKFVKSFVKKAQLPLIIDADALTCLTFKEIPHAILTPHKGELKIMCKNSKIICNSKSIQELLGKNILVVKGPTDTIQTKTKTFYNKTGNAGMTKAGTGDVLAGLIAGLVAQGVPLLQAAKTGTFVNGKIGDLLLKKRGYYSYIASDMIQDIKNILSKLRR